jgi:hypothetical protein
MRNGPSKVWQMSAGQQSEWSARVATHRLTPQRATLGNRDPADVSVGRKQGNRGH